MFVNKHFTYLKYACPRNAPLFFSKIINAVTFKLSTKVAHLKYFKKMWWKY